ncbi:elongation factor tu GTP-binding domain-containing protein 2 [Thecamonas trahens ATCC 50062]|uniref:Elongation factor tu GTP-binding domain-containing protein 2 n=1 Tax=Thecamonas trahens ATCC 50062 TaxID=461836 RepID=A0A0L0DE68_THETB|nr:elongation factor tu GTP-binding domain-containing protein 2 [Thecamonas trahens ATCC 50062]KNC50461.1 elongation factor tu GTP-binding domain-containing protein 2 [Thecamonas trahens ATCC 50062]|eukprot:XP_013762357.1 elongation factor tu GTP-binding domain-containing protein 2 [Thecamonas trahens ATCC 50062]
MALNLELYDEFGNYVGPPLSSSSSSASSSSSDTDSDDEDTAAALHAPVRVRDTSSSIVLAEDKVYYASSAEVFGQGVETIVATADRRSLNEPLVAPHAGKQSDVNFVNDYVAKVDETTSAGDPVPRLVYSPEYLAATARDPRRVRCLALVGPLHSGKTLLADVLLADAHADRSLFAGAKSKVSLGNMTRESAFTATVADLATPHLPDILPLGKSRFLDSRADEMARRISIKSSPATVLLPDAAGRSHVLNIMDTPGHVAMRGEVAPALRVADGVVLVVDAVEGLLARGKALIAAAAAGALPLVLVINKLDRLVLEARLPPKDAYHKLRHLIEAVNDELALVSSGTSIPSVSPVDGSVVFASALHGWTLSLPLLAARTLAASPAHPDNPAAVPPAAVAALAKRLWGDAYYSPASAKFTKRPPSKSAPRSFVTFVLEPMYKIYTAGLTTPPAALPDVMAAHGVALTPAEAASHPATLLRLLASRALCGAPWEPSTALVAAVARHLPHPVAALGPKLALAYMGPPIALIPRAEDDPAPSAAGAADPFGLVAYESELADTAPPSSQILSLDDATVPASPAHLLVNVVKLYPWGGAGALVAFGRVVAGTLTAGASVTLLEEGYVPGGRFGAAPDEGTSAVTVSKLWIPVGRYRIAVPSAGPGAWVYIGGIASSFARTATLVAPDALRPTPDVYAFAPLPLDVDNEAVVKLALEPLVPSELPKMLDGLHKLRQTYPLLETRVEESGERLIFGTGELMLDSALADLRNEFAGIEIKVSDPAVKFCETVVEPSSLQTYATTPNGANTLTVMAEPLGRPLTNDLAAGELSLAWEPDDLIDVMESKYNWDALAAASIWAFGPDPARGPNMLLDDTLAGGCDPASVAPARAAITQGFRWATKAGPLCDEPVRGVRFSLLDATLADAYADRSSGQIIPTMRRVTYASMLMATPRLMEPIYAVEIYTPPDAVSAVFTVVSRRRGRVLGELPNPGTPHIIVSAEIPVIDSFGFETDLRVHTQGMAFCSLTFDHWDVLRSDPLDASIELAPLEPAPPVALARDFMLKTRRRKGLTPHVSIAKYIDDETLLQAATAQLYAAYEG